MTEAHPEQHVYFHLIITIFFITNFIVFWKYSLSTKVIIKTILKRFNCWVKLRNLTDDKFRFLWTITKIMNQIETNVDKRK